MTEPKNGYHDAADRIERQGWVQGDPGYVPETGACCLATALDMSKRGGFTGTSDSPVIEKLGLVQGSVSLIRWNDRKGRTSAEVVAVLRAVGDEQPEDRRAA